MVTTITKPTTAFDIIIVIMLMTGLTFSIMTQTVRLASSAMKTDVSVHLRRSIENTMST